MHSSSISHHNPIDYFKIKLLLAVRYEPFDFFFHRYKYACKDVCMQTHTLPFLRLLCNSIMKIVQSKWYLSSCGEIKAQNLVTLSLSILNLQCLRGTLMASSCGREALTGRDKQHSDHYRIYSC